MNAAAWGTVAVIGTLIVGVIGTYLLARSNARENQRQQSALTEKAVTAALAPLNARLVEQDRTIDQKDRIIEIRDARINALEDRLYGGGDGERRDR